MSVYVDETFFASVRFAEEQVKQVANHFVGQPTTFATLDAIKSALNIVETHILQTYRLPMRFDVRLRGSDLVIKAYFDDDFH